MVGQSTGPKSYKRENGWDFSDILEKYTPWEAQKSPFFEKNKKKQIIPSKLVKIIDFFG